MTCKGLFGRHRWVKPHRFYRICRDCGRTEEQFGTWNVMDFPKWHEYVMHSVTRDLERASKKHRPEALQWIDEFLQTGLLNRVLPR